MKFLVIDDEFSCRAILRKILVDQGQCDIAVDGLEMIEAFEISLKADAVYDMLFLDIMMPKMDGIEALFRVRELEKIYGIEEQNQVKVIMTSALNDVKTRKRCEELSICGYLHKPFYRSDVEAFFINKTQVQ